MASIVNIFSSYTNAQANESIEACKKLLTKIYEKGNVPINDEDANVLNQSISTLHLLMCDVETEWQSTPVYCALAKAQIKLHTQKIKNEMGFFDNADKKADLKESIGFIDDTLKLLIQQ